MSDIRVGTCIVGKSKSGYAWYCVECGDSKVGIGSAKKADRMAREHKCQ